MKKLHHYLIACLMVLGMVFPVFGAEGSASIAHHQSYYSSSTTETWETKFYISNITSSTVSVTITFNDYDGTLIQDDDSATTGDIRGGNITNFDDTPTGASVTFDLAAKKTGYISVNSSAWKYGHGTIKWSQTGTGVYKALIVHAKCYRSKTSSGLVYQSAYYIPINKGLPF